MSREEPEDVARLRTAFESVKGDGQERVDAERIFDALHGTLDPEDRRAVVDELVSNPDPRKSGGWRVRWIPNLARCAPSSLGIGDGWPWRPESR